MQVFVVAVFSQEVIIHHLRRNNYDVVLLDPQPQSMLNLPNITSYPLPKFTIF